MQQPRQVRESSSYGRESNVLTFDSKQEKWHKFICIFKEFIKASGQGPVLEMDMLSVKIQAEACRLLIGITDQAEARDRLNKLYGDKQLAVINAMKDLMQLKMWQGLPFVRNEALVQAVRLTKIRLQAVGKENQLFFTLLY